MPYPESSLAQSFLNNDPEAVGLVIRWIATALAVPRFWNLRRDWSDLMQETLLRTTRSLRSGHYDPARDFRAYVQGIARIVCLEAFGKQTQSALHEFHGDAPEAGADGPASHMVERQLVRRVLDQASEECREIFRLYYVEGKDYQEIASAAGIPIGTVKSRLFRCLECAFHALAPAGGRSRVRQRRLESVSRST